MESTNDRPAFLGPALPTYPGLYELVRVYAAALLGGGNVYPCFVTQLDTTQAKPTFRDRAQAFLVEPNGIALSPGYYDARLVGSYNGSPLYVTNCCPLGSSSSGAGH